MIIKIHPDNPQGRQIARVVEILEKGGIIAYPTDTQYGVGCDLKQKKTIERLYSIKQRSFKRPFSLICADLTNISEYAIVSDFAYRSLKRTLPGPFTFVLPGTRLVPQLMLSKQHECGLRIPAHNIPIEIIKALGRPIINTSASLSEEPAPLVAEEIEELFKGKLDAVIDGGQVPGRPSTIVSLINDDPQILRQGLGVF